MTNWMLWPSIFAHFCSFYNTPLSSFKILHYDYLLHASVCWNLPIRLEYRLSLTASSNLSGLLASDVAKGAIRDHESTGSLTPPRSTSPSPNHKDNDVFSNKVEYVPVRNASSVSSEPRPSWSSSDSERSGGEKRSSRVSASHVPAWYKDMQKGVEVPVQKIEDSESYMVQRRPVYGEKSELCGILQLSCGSYGPSRTFIVKLLGKSLYEGRAHKRELGRKKPYHPDRNTYCSVRCDFRGFGRF